MNNVGCVPGRSLSGNRICPHFSKVLCECDPATFDFHFYGAENALLSVSGPE